MANLSKFQGIKNYSDEKGKIVNKNSKKQKSTLDSSQRKAPL